MNIDKHPLLKELYSIMLKAKNLDASELQILTEISQALVEFGEKLEHELADKDKKIDGQNENLRMKDARIRELENKLGFNLSRVEIIVD